MRVRSGNTALAAKRNTALHGKAERACPISDRGAWRWRGLEIVPDFLSDFGHRNACGKGGGRAARSWRPEIFARAGGGSWYRRRMSGVVQLIDSELMDATLARAVSSSRGRINHNFHPSLSDNPHRFLNAWTRGSYAAPHRHLKVPKPESFVVLRGELALFIFDDDGTLTETHILGRGGVVGIDLAPGVWHTVAALTETAICFEVKAGPYDAATDKEFATWAPREGDPAAAAYLTALYEKIGQ